MILKAAKLIFFFCLPFLNLTAQNKAPYSFQDLSGIFYSKQKDSIRKSWICPVLYKEKETQKKYKEMWDERTNFITSAMEANNFVHDEQVFNYISQIVKELADANPGIIAAKPVVLLDRSASVNAYSIGGNIIAVNAGLITFANYREEIALVVAHELAHNILNHSDKSMKERAEWLTSDDYKKSLNSVLDSKYERLSRLKKILEVFSFSRSRHNRYHESEADSLAIVLLKNSHVSINPAFFLRLDSADIQYKHPLKNPLKYYFTPFNVPFEEGWTQRRSKGLSTKSYNFRDTSGIADSIKTHPECKDRYNKTLAYATLEATNTSIPVAIKEQATKMLIWNMFDNMNLTGCLYRILMEKDNGNKDEWYDFMIHNIFEGLYYSDKQLNRFNAIGVVPKEFISSNYYELQNMLEQIPRESLEQYCKQLQTAAFWQNMHPDAKSLKSLISSINFDEDATAKRKEIAAKDFFENHPSSMYCEFADHFKKK